MVGVMARAEYTYDCSPDLTLPSSALATGSRSSLRPLITCTGELRPLPETHIQNRSVTEGAKECIDLTCGVVRAVSVAFQSHHSTTSATDTDTQALAGHTATDMNRGGRTAISPHRSEYERMRGRHHGRPCSLLAITTDEAYGMAQRTVTAITSSESLAITFARTLTITTCVRARQHEANRCSFSSQIN